MVYRGKPSAGCENCRKAKKRCTLEQPACTRCVKLKKECVGYRDTTQLQIQDETQSVLQKVERRKANAAASSVAFKEESSWQSNTHPVPTKSNTGAKPKVAKHLPVPQSYEHALNFIFDSGRYHGPVTNPGSLMLDPKNQQLRRLPELELLSTHAYGASAYAVNFNLSNVFTLMQWATGIPNSPRPLPDDVAINMFLNCCTAENQWTYFQQPSFMQERGSCLDFAIKACGMAALNNVRPLQGGREWSRTMYTKAIGLLNTALKDPKKSRHDDSLVAVTMLGFYENLTCDSMQSIRSWKAHIQGATQLLRIRGKSQFNTIVGRQLFRELRAQILISCIWDDRKPPDFLKEWQVELANKSTSLTFIGPTDELMDICFTFAEMRSGLKENTLTKEAALEIANTIDAQLIQWALDTPNRDERWQYQELQVDDGPNIWNGMLHSYACLPIPGVLNLHRSIRILVSRTHELLTRSISRPNEQTQTQAMYFRTVRRQMSDEICASIPCVLGHAAPAFSSPCVLVTAYNTIWPIFFAATCAFERLGLNIWEEGEEGGRLKKQSGFNAAAFSSAASQAAWLLGRLDYISKVIGLKWAEGIAGSIREAIKVHKSKAIEYRATLTPGSLEEVEYLSIVGEIIRGVMAWRQQLGASAPALDLFR